MNTSGSILTFHKLPFFPPSSPLPSTTTTTAFLLVLYNKNPHIHNTTTLCHPLSLISFIFYLSI